MLFEVSFPLRRLRFGDDDDDHPSEYSANSHPSDRQILGAGIIDTPVSKAFPGRSIPGLFPNPQPGGYHSEEDEVWKRNQGILRAERTAFVVPVPRQQPSRAPHRFTSSHGEGYQGTWQDVPIPNQQLQSNHMGRSHLQSHGTVMLPYLIFHQNPVTFYPTMTSHYSTEDTSTPLGPSGSVFSDPYGAGCSNWMGMSSLSIMEGFFEYVQAFAFAFPYLIFFYFGIEC